MATTRSSFVTCGGTASARPASVDEVRPPTSSPVCVGSIPLIRGSGRGVTSDVLRRVVDREYPDPRQGIFLNSASWGILPRSAAEEVADLTLRRNRTHGFEESELGAIQRRCRSAVAALLGGQASEIALSPNTSYGIGLAAALLRAGPPGRIIVSEGEFPANVLPFKALEKHGFVVDVIPCTGAGWPDEERMIASLDGPGVVALTVSSVQFATGYAGDLRKLGEACRARGILFVIDAIQGVGAYPFSPNEVFADLVAVGGQKWLCAPWGSGFTWMRKEVQERFDPPMVSWLATSGGADFSDMLHYGMEWRENARKFELATLGIQDYLGLARSVEVLLEVGVDNIRRHIHALHEPVLDWIDSRADARCVTPRDPERRAGILAFELSDVDGAAEALRAQRVVFSVREGLIRLAPHFHNTVEEMETVVRILDSADPSVRSGA
jgi:cysteine desulfurase/selenocysteine lyase